MTKFEPHSDLDLSGSNPSLVRDTLNIYGYFIYEKMYNPSMHTEVLEPILPPSSKLILNNIKNDKV
jgi:hypothetical protein